MQSCFVSASVESTSHQQVGMNNLLQCLSTKLCFFYGFFPYKKKKIPTLSTAFVYFFIWFVIFIPDIWLIENLISKSYQKKLFKIYTVWQNCPTSILFDWALHSCMFFHFFLLLQNWRGQPFTVCQVIKRHLLPQVNPKHWEEIRIRYLELLFQFGSYWHWLYYIIKPQAANGNSTGSAQNHLEPLFSSASYPSSRLIPAMMSVRQLWKALLSVRVCPLF